MGGIEDQLRKEDLVRAFINLPSIRMSDCFMDMGYILEIDTSWLLSSRAASSASLDCYVDTRGLEVI